MLSAAIQATWRSQYAQLIYALGTAALWTQAKAPNQTADLVVGFRGLGRDDLELINAYGVEAKAVTVVITDLPVPPQKFDNFHIHGEDFVAQAVHTTYMNGLAVSYRVMVVGR